ncbi:hypothetical protein [Desulfovibrio sp.]|uniref:hypothetical protein n=1 Tax=Desulfovibrio TaxID=872 RepID=UPI0025C20B0D|nr:hypothetical protein [Desulfovibrio sp.]
MLDLLVVLSDLRVNPPEFNRIWNIFEIFFLLMKSQEKAPCSMSMEVVWNALSADGKFFAMSSFVVINNAKKE